MKLWIWIGLLLAPVLSSAASFEIQIEGSNDQLLLAGTLDPPTLTLNGHGISLEKRESLKPGVWINGKSYPANDKMGRFFVQLSGERELEVHLQGARGAWGVTIPIGAVFIERPLHEVRTLPDADSKSGVLLKLEGPLQEGEELLVDGKRLQGHGASVAVELKLPIGDSVISAELRRAGQSPRLINVPVKVIKIAAKDNAAKDTGGSGLVAQMTQTAMMIFKGGSLPGKVIVPYSDPFQPGNFSVGLRRPVWKTLNGEIQYTRLSEMTGNRTDQVQLNLRRGNLFQLGADAPFGHVWIGASLLWFSAAMDGVAFQPDPGSINSFGLSFHAEGAFLFWRRFSYAPRFEIANSALGFHNSAPASWTYISIQPLGVRADF